MFEELMQWKDFFLRTAEKEGPHMALFYTCIAANIPFVISDIPEDIGNGDDLWDRYVENLIEAGHDKSGAREAEWLDGVTDIRWVFGKNLTQKDFGAAIAAEKERLGKLPGTQLQRDRWGVKGNGKTFTVRDYERMDALFDAYAADYVSSGLSRRQEQTLIRYVKCLFLADKADEEGDYKGSAALYKNADLIMASEAMRAKDEKPTEKFRFDAAITAMEQAGLMRDGHFLSFEDTQRALARFIHPKDGNPRYKFSVDVCDQILLNWENNMRKNSAQAEVFELPAEMKVYDDYEECMPEETEAERALKQQMDLSKVRFSKKRGSE